MPMIDFHTHINMLDKDPIDSLDEASSEGVNHVITIGTQPSDHPTVLELARKYSEVFCTLGVHPHDAKEYNQECEDYIRENSKFEKVVAVAEIGLDYFYDNSPRDIQKEVFERQLQLSLDLNLPVQIHTRDAEEDTKDILKNFDGKIKGALHCFTGTQWLADESLKLGLNISISGIVTFKNANDLRDVVKSIPIDRLHIETDAPFLTPVPNRGKPNAPKYLRYVRDCVADLKGISPEDLESQCLKNATSLMPRLSNHL